MWRIYTRYKDLSDPAWTRFTLLFLPLPRCRNVSLAASDPIQTTYSNMLLHRLKALFSFKDATPHYSLLPTTSTNTNERNSSSSSSSSSPRTQHSFDSISEPQEAEQEKQFPQSSYPSTNSNTTQARGFKINPRTISDATIGLSDGLTVPFALTAGLSALGDTKLVIYAGLAELIAGGISICLLYTSPSPRDGLLSRMPSSA